MICCAVVRATKESKLCASLYRLRVNRSHEDEEMMTWKQGRFAGSKEIKYFFDNNLRLAIHKKNICHHSNSIENLHNNNITTMI